MKLWLLFLFSGFIPSKVALAAACCGGGFIAPSIISGDEKAQLTTSYAVTEVVVDNVDAKGVWRRWEEHQQVQTFRLEGAHLLSDRWQAGFVLPVMQRSHLDQEHSGLGDVSFSLGYEYLPDWDYNPIRPKGIGFLQLILPTGKSRAESERGGLDSRGNGFWAVGAGTLLTKAFGRYDVFTLLQAHHSFAKEFSNSQMKGTLKPGFGGVWSLGGGYSFQSLRLGTSVIWNYEDGVNVEGESPSSGAVERFATVMLSASYLADANWAVTLSYLDQTWLGNPVNTSLGRTASVQVQKRWSR